MPAASSPATEKAKPHQTPQSQESSPGSSIPCGQGTPTATSLQPPAQSNDSTSSQASEATVAVTLEEKIPKSLNGKGVKNSRKQLQCPQLLPKKVDSASDVDSWVT